MEKFVSTDFLKMPGIKQMDVQVFSTAYFGPVSYYQTMLNGSRNLLDTFEHYEKQSFRNRCSIAGPHGVQNLSIPVEYKAKMLVRDIKISKHSEWQLQHWRSLQAAYQSSPFYEYFFDDLYPLFQKEWLYLCDLNNAAHSCVEQLLDIDTKLKFSEKYVDAAAAIDWRNSIHPKKPSVATTADYYQVFAQKNGFAPDLSILDLLFNMGNESILILENR